MRIRFSIVALPLLSIVTGELGRSRAAAQGNEKTKLEQLLAENQNLTLQIGKAKKTETQIAKAELSISGNQAALTRAQGELRRSGEGLQRQAEGIVGQARAAGCPWGSKSTDEAFVNACNTEGARLMALFEEVKRKAMSQQEYAVKLQERQTELNNLTLDLFKKKKANNADLQDLYDARAAWQERYNAFVFDSEAYRRLKKMAPASKECERMSWATHPDALDRAAQCLRRLWDGAR